MIHKIIKYNIFVFVFALLFASCEEKMVVIPEFQPPDSDRVVLIEDMTGVKCPNCPKGSAAIEDIKAVYPGQVISVAIHGIFLCDPLDESKYDFRNPIAADLERYLEPFIGKPAAVVNRIKFDDQIFLALDALPEAWQTFVERAFDVPLQLDMEVSGSYNADNRQYTLNVGIVPLEDLQDDFRISVMITQDGIVDAQEYPDRIDPDYTHNHVLIDMMTNFDGDPLPSSLQKNEIINRTFVYDIPAEDGPFFNTEKMNVVVFVSSGDLSNRQVYQAAELHVEQ